MDPNKRSPILPKYSSGRKRSPIRRIRASVMTSPDGAFDEEVLRIKQLILGLSAQLDHSEKKVELNLRKIDQNLADLAIQKEQIRILERGLGIERQG